MKHTHFQVHEIERLKALKGKPLATFTQRALAFLIDVVFSLILLTFGTIVFALITGKARLLAGGNIEFNIEMGNETAEIVHTVLEFVFPILYSGTMTYLTQGYTIGKLVMGIRVVSISHERLTFVHCAERAMAYATSVAEFGLGFAQFFMNPNHRTLGDKVADTIVIRERGKKGVRASAGEVVQTVEMNDLVEAELESLT